MQGKRTKRGQRGGLNRRKRSGGGFFHDLQLIQRFFRITLGEQD